MTMTQSIHPNQQRKGVAFLLAVKLEPHLQKVVTESTSVIVLIIQLEKHRSVMMHV